VFNEGGFDCILGNPPYLGGLKLSTNYGYEFLNYLYANYQGAKGTADLVTYFFRRDFDIIKRNGFLSLISTNTISQGGTREGGLTIILANSGVIVHSIKSMKWPGLAAVDVSLVSIFKGNWTKNVFLNFKTVKQITAYLDDQEIFNAPFKLFNNSNESFIGSFVLGSGFLLNELEAKNLININERNKEVIHLYLNGDDISNNPSQEASRYVINFQDWDEEYCKTNYPECYDRVLHLVKPERDKINRANRKSNWWKFAERAPRLYNTIQSNGKVLVQAQTSKQLCPVFVKSNQIYSLMCVVFKSESFSLITILNSNLHDAWAWKYCSTNSISLRYTPSSAFETFPFSKSIKQEKKQQLETFGEIYHEHRRQLMLGMQLGLTKTYNLFHSNAITAQSVDTKDKQVVNLQKHLEKTANTFSFDESIEGILKLRELHVKMDLAVLDAYGWSDIQLHHDFYEVDYLPENDRVRYTIHPDARKEVLKRLLELNHQIHAEELEAGLFDKKPAAKSKKKKDTNPDQNELF
jgi:hypothetical protein